MGGQIAVVLRAGGWHPGAVAGRGATAAQLTEELLEQAKTLADGAADFVGFDNAAHLHTTAPEPWRLVEIDALAVAHRLVAGVRPRCTVVPTVTVADLGRPAAAELPGWAGAGVELQVRVTNRLVGAGPMATPLPPPLDHRDPEVLRGMDSRFTAAAGTIAAARAAWSESGAGPGPRLWALAHLPIPYRLAARACDVVVLTPATPVEASSVLGEVRAMETGRTAPLRTFADLTVCLGATAAAAAGRLRELDRRAAAPWRPDAALVVGTGADLADTCAALLAAGFDGVRLRLCAAEDVELLAAVLPELADRVR